MHLYGKKAIILLEIFVQIKPSLFKLFFGIEGLTALLHLAQDTNQNHQKHSNN